MVYFTKSPIISYACSIECRSEWVSGIMWEEAAMKEFDVGGKPLKWRQNVGSRFPSDRRHTAEEWNPQTQRCRNFQTLDMLAGF